MSDQFMDTTVGHHKATILCPGCKHRITAHIGRCSVYLDDYDAGICECEWTPNDIAAVLLDEQRERIARALDAEERLLEGGAA